MAREVCNICKRPNKVCFCDLIKPISNQWPVTIIQHVEEVNHSIGTAKIAQLSLEKCQTHIVKDNEAFDEHQHNLAQGVLVYPKQGALTIDDLALQTAQPLIFIDASWRKSKKIMYQSSYLQSLPTVGFCFDSVSRYRIRKQPKEGYCSTLEAIEYLLTTLENNKEKYSNLLKVMDWMINQQLSYFNKTDQ